MQTSVEKIHTHRNQALCYAGTELGIGDTIEALEYRDGDVTIRERNATLVKIEGNRITIQPETAGIATIDINTITYISN